MPALDSFCPKAVVKVHDSVAFSPCSHASEAAFFHQIPEVQVTEVGNTVKDTQFLSTSGQASASPSRLVSFEVSQTSRMLGAKTEKGVLQGESKRCV